MKHINHLGFVTSMISLMAVSMIAIGLFGTVVERDIVQLSTDRPVITIPVTTGQVAGITSEQSRIIIDRGEGEVLQVEFPVIEGMTVEDVLKQITIAFELDLQTDQSNGNTTVVQIGDFRNGDADKQWQYSVDGRTPLYPMNTREIKGGETIFFRFINQS